MASYSSRPAMALKEGVSYSATIEMEDGGRIELELWPDKAPEHVNSFVFLANDGFYDGVTFHRIISGFMAQGGDPTGTGTGGPGYHVPAEFNDTAHVEGVLSMARAQDPNSAGSQFFICNADATFLDRQYTAFGKVTSGMEVVHAFPDRDPQDPRQSRQPGPKMKSVTITES
ncbi:MAG: peptidylprolyl isomerase [Chloroflexota bacterium]|nr:peptidylprolyl isomerase [Chloroflexota bacterium]